MPRSHASSISETLSIATRYRVALIREPTPEYDAPKSCQRPGEVVSFVRQLLSDWSQEVVGAVMLNCRNQAVGHVIAAIGTQIRVTVDPRNLLVPALLANASGIVLFHNHPSGDPTPSVEDRRFTERLKRAGELVGVRLVDSLIVTPHRGKWVSLHGEEVSRGRPC